MLFLCGEHSKSLRSAAAAFLEQLARALDRSVASLGLHIGQACL